MTLSDDTVTCDLPKPKLDVLRNNKKRINFLTSSTRLYPRPLATQELEFVRLLLFRDSCFPKFLEVGNVRTQLFS